MERGKEKDGQTDGGPRRQMTEGEMDGKQRDGETYTCIWNGQRTRIKGGRGEE